MAATELEGKPLKFTALFDSKDAEMQMDEFLKKIQTINTKGVGSSAIKTVNNASGQYKSILDGATQSFQDFVNSNERFYASIAQSEMGLQKIRNEQSILNSELKKGLVTEDEYINKTAQLTQIRERLSQQLKDNKAQLQQYNSVANAKPKFTRQDTLNELAAAHGSNTVSIPSMSISEAYLKKYEENVAKLNKEFSDLDNKLQKGAITNSEYAESTAKINAKMVELQAEKKFFDNTTSNSAPTEELNKQKSVLDAVSDQYKEMVSDASSAFQSLSPKARGLTNNLVSLREDSRKLALAQKELDTSFKNGDITQKQYLEATRNLGVQQNAVRSRIAETRKELAQIDNAEKRAIGSIAEKSAKLTQLKQRYDQLSEAQRNNANIGGKLRQEYQQLSADVNKLNNSLTGTKSEGIGSVFTSVRGIAGALGIAFGAQQLISFGKELFSIAQQAEGIKLRFAKIGDTTGLEKLRKATKDTVSDLELMKLAINADNFRIPMDVLAKGLEFATRRAGETGQSVDYLVNSFVTGLGRKSTLILDNLGISASELNEEVKKTGDFAAAVGVIIQREMDKSGEAVDTLANKTGRLATEWQNFKLSLSKGFNAVFNAGAPDAKNVEKLTEGYKKGFETVKQYGLDAQKAFVLDKEIMLKNVNQELSKLSKDSKYFEELYKAQNSKSPTELLNSLRKPLVEQQQALQSSLNYAKALTGEFEKQARQNKGVFSQSEIEENLNKYQSDYKNAVGDKERAEAKKEIDKWQKLLDDVSIKSTKASDKKAESEAKKLQEQIKKDKEAYEKIIKEAGELGGRYTIEIVSSEQAEINKVIDDYDKLIERAKEYNKTSKASDRVDIANLEVEKGLSVNNTIERQEKASEKKKLEEQEKLQKEAYEAMLKLSATNESKIADIRKKYSDAYEVLEKDKTKFTIEEYEKRKEALKKGQTEEIASVLLPDLQKDQDWTNVFEKSSELARSKIESSVESLRASLDKMLAEGTISAEKYDEILKQIKGVEVQITVNEKGFGRLKQVLKELRESEKGSVKYDQARQKLAQEINYWGQGLVQAGDEAVNIADQLGIGSEKFREDMGLALDTASNAVNLASSIASGDVVGMVVNGIKTISSAINLFSKDRKIEKRIKEYQAQIEQLGKAYDELARKMSNSDTDFYSNSELQIKNLKDQEQALIKSREAERSKKKSDGDKINAYDQKILDNRNQQLDLEKSIRQMRLQTDINSLAQSITDALVGAFEAGEDGIDSMDKAFDNFTKNSLANSARLRFVQQIVEDMLNDVDSYASKNGNSIVGYDFTKFRQKLDTANQQVFDFLEQAYAGLGLTKDGESNSSLKAEEGITRMSESTGTEIVGMYRAGYDLQKQHLLAFQAFKDSYNSNSTKYLTIANDKLTALNAIQVNTANTVARLDVAVSELQGIRKALR